MSKRIQIGEYLCGNRNVRIIAETGTTGGSFRVTPKTGSTELVVSVGYNRWCEVFQVLTHEAMELAMLDCGCRFKPTPDNADAHDGYVFWMTHPQFSEVAARVGEFISASAHDLFKAWKKHKRSVT